MLKNLFKTKQIQEKETMTQTHTEQARAKVRETVRNITKCENALGRSAIAYSVFRTKTYPIDPDGKTTSSAFLVGRLNHHPFSCYKNSHLRQPSKDINYLIKISTSTGFTNRC